MHILQNKIGRVYGLLNYMYNSVIKVGSFKKTAGVWSCNRLMKLNKVVLAYGKSVYLY
jgi:hypothetical protein